MAFRTFAALALLASRVNAIASITNTTFTNTQRFLFDVYGNQIDAYGSKINYFNGAYYLYGNSFAIEGVAFGIKSYSSVDLVHWQPEGFLYDPYSTNPCSGTGGCGRPHIVYNAKNRQYVLWANAGSDGYVVATSSSPTGPFGFLAETAAIDPQFDSLHPADFAVEVFGNDAYIVFSALNSEDPDAGSLWPPIFQTLHISPLTADFLNTTLQSYPVRSAADDLIDQQIESPDIFKRNGSFYVAASNTCGYCNGSIGLIYRSSSIQGPWTREIISGYSCDGQVEGVLPLQGPNGATSYVWHSTTVPGQPRTGFSGHIFQPLNFETNGTVQDLQCSPSASFNVQFQRGTGSVASGAATTAGDASPLQAAYSAVCDSDQFELFQTWRASRSGALKSVSVNVAKSVQTVPLAITLFKFSNYSALVAPEYKYTELGTASLNASALTYVFDLATVNVTSNSSITEGEMLGFSISGIDYAPYCHLEYDTGSNPSSKLFVQGNGQNSWRGLQGRTSPVYERVGKGVKFFATYE